MLFPHEQQRPIQSTLLNDIHTAITTKTPLIAHAPTGLGKTAAALAPALTEALTKQHTIFFLTARHTQHDIILKTINAIKQRHATPITGTSIIGKKWMCAQPGATSMRTQEFKEYCKHLRENNQCNHYTNAKKLTNKDPIFQQLAKDSPQAPEKLANTCSNNTLCPYEVTLQLAKQSTIIITDYFYLFHPDIRNNFLAKIEKQLDNSILIIDEGHNLSNRLRDMMTDTLTNHQLQRAIKEAQRYHLDDATNILNQLHNTLTELAHQLTSGTEQLIQREDLMLRITTQTTYDDILTHLEFASEIVYDNQPHSSISSIHTFLTTWREDSTGYARILTKNNPTTTLHHRCLDPALVAQPVIQNAHSVILMSGTLTPTTMYRDLLGFPQKTTLREYPSPFPTTNRLALIVPKTTTKYSARTEHQYANIANELTNILKHIPGSSLLFFPSYAIRDAVYKHLEPLTPKTCFLEQPNLTKEEKNNLIERFKTYKGKAIMLCVAAGSFGEGIDLPGILDNVIVIGLPLDRPNLETKELITYYDTKLGKGWEYGYILPALTKTFQNAGRCIRTETDRGALIFLDERYPQYRHSFPTDWNVTITTNPTEHLRNFFA